MSVRILSFMKIALGKTMEVVKKLKSFPEVVEINYITGEYDLVMEITESSSEKINNLFINKIDKIEEITKLSSHLLIKRWYNEKFDKKQKLYKNKKLDKEENSL